MATLTDITVSLPRKNYTRSLGARVRVNTRVEKEITLFSNRDASKKEKGDWRR